jgi:hypothetical protein
MTGQMKRRDLLEISPFQSDDGELIGKYPSDVPLEILSLKFRAQNPLKAIRERCLDCCCGNASEVRKCTLCRSVTEALRYRRGMGSCGQGRDGDAAASQA